MNQNLDMGKDLYSVLKYRHITEPTNEIIEYINNRRKGIIESLKTRWKKFNRLCMGGIEPNTIYTIAGISGSGKSSFVNTLETDLFDLNPGVEFVVLNFSFEMLSSKNIGRKLSYRLRKTTTELYSSNKEKPLEDDEFKQVLEISKELLHYPVYYVDVPGNVQEIRNTILNFMETTAKGKWLIVILDHVLLTKGRSGNSEREILSDLQYMFIEMKKYGKNTIIQVSQMNRDIESADRITNNYLHFPMRKDIFGSEGMFQASDYVIVLHRPELLGITNYGPNNWPVSNLIYMHLLKNREGDLGTLAFENNLKYNRIDEIDIRKETSKKVFPI